MPINLKNILLASAVIILMVVTAYWMTRPAAPTPEPGPATEETNNPTTPEDGTPGGATKPAEPRRTGTVRIISNGDDEISRLQEFLDDDNREAALEQAIFLSESDDARRRSEAIDALVWLATPKAAQALLPLLNDPDEDIASEALNAAKQILDTVSLEIAEDPESGELATTSGGGFDATQLQQLYEVWRDTCKAIPDVEELDTMLISLSGLDAKFSIPILAELAETLQGEKRQAALRHLDQATDGDGVTNRDEAAVWLMEHSKKN